MMLQSVERVASEGDDKDKYLPSVKWSLMLRLLCTDTQVLPFSSSFIDYDNDIGSHSTDSLSPSRIATLQ